MRPRNDWNDIPHWLQVDELFAPDDSPAHEMDIPEEFDSFEAAADWVSEATDTPGVEREHFYCSNDYAGGNMGNAMSQGELT